MTMVGWCRLWADAQWADRRYTSYTVVCMPLFSRFYTSTKLHCMITEAQGMWTTCPRLYAVVPWPRASNPRPARRESDALDKKQTKKQSDPKASRPLTTHSTGSGRSSHVSIWIVLSIHSSLAARSTQWRGR